MIIIDHDLLFIKFRNFIMKNSVISSFSFFFFINPIFHQNTNNIKCSWRNKELKSDYLFICDLRDIFTFVQQKLKLKTRVAVFK